MRVNSIVVALALTLMAAVASAPAQIVPDGEIRFNGIGSLPDCPYPGTVATAVSNNGRVVVGYGSNLVGDCGAFRWTTEQGVVPIGAGPWFNQAFDVSSDGSVVVGHLSSRIGLEVFRWTEDGGIVGFGTSNAHGRGVSGDGEVVVGYGRFGLGEEAFRWTEDEGVVPLGFVPGSSASRTQGSAVSADGSTIVGWGFGPEGPGALRWTEENGMEPLGEMPEGFHQSVARAVSADGEVVVGGIREIDGLLLAFRWTEAEGYVGIGSLGGTPESEALGVSADGSIVVGTSMRKAFIWHASTGMVNLREVLIGAGVDLFGWDLEAAVAISDDGRAVAGNGFNPMGDREAWVFSVPNGIGSLLGL